MRFNMIRVTEPQYVNKFAPSQYHKPIFVYSYGDRLAGDYSVIIDAPNENRLRQQIAILRKFANQSRDRYLQHLDLAVMKAQDGKGYRLLTYTRNWKERASYYAGIIVGVERTSRRKRKKRKKAMQS